MQSRICSPCNYMLPDHFEELFNKMKDSAQVAPRITLYSRKGAKLLSMPTGEGGLGRAQVISVTKRIILFQ